MYFLQKHHGLYALLLALSLGLSLPQSSHAQEGVPSQEEPAASEDSDAPSEADKAAQEQESAHEKHTTDLQRAIAPRADLATAVDTLLSGSTAWQEHHTWLDAVSAHAEHGRDAWTAARCESTLDAAQRAYQGIGDIDRIKHPRIQRQAEILLDAAAACEDAAYTDLALRAVNRAVPQMRTQPILPTFRDALVYLSSYKIVKQLRRTDTRLLLPYIDALLHIRDHAALERLTTLKLDANPSVGKERLEQANGRAKKSSTFRLPIDAPKDCQRPTLDGERLRGKDVELRRGSHMIACDNDDERLRFYNPANRAIF